MREEPSVLYTLRVWLLLGLGLSLDVDDEMGGSNQVPCGLYRFWGFISIYFMLEIGELTA